MTMGQQQLCCRIAVLTVWFLTATPTSTAAGAVKHADKGNLAAAFGKSAVQAARRMLPEQQAAIALAASGPPEYLSDATTNSSAANGQGADNSASTASAADTATSSVSSAVSPASRSSSSRSTQDSELRQQSGLARDLRLYLEGVFRDAPDALLKIGQAWQQEEQEGESGGWFGILPPNIGQQQQQQQVQAMGGPSGSPADAEALNAQYEATLPQYKSRIYDQVAARGYPLERHAVVTPDGYELIVHRIPHGKLRNNQPGVKKPAVFLQHGVTLASDCFTVFGANESMAYILADAGYDVWMGNTRGNTYSRRNANGLYTYQAEFWYFSLDDLALIDVPTMIDYVLEKTGASKLAFVGHSQGGTLGTMLCASRPEYNQKISVLALMGPVVFVDYMQSAFLKVFTSELDQPWQVSGEFLPNRLIAPVYKNLCSHWPMDEVCVAAISFVSFGPSQHVSAADYLTLSGSWPSSVGSRNLVHWGQIYKSPELELRMFDHGIACNVTTWHPVRGFQPKPFRETCNAAEYGRREPPVYDLTKVTAPVVIFAGGQDIMAAPEDIAEQVRRLGAAHKRTILYPDYTHMDFSWDRNARAPVDLLGELQQYSPGTY